jgi:drebrin-like protein
VNPFAAREAQAQAEAAQPKPVASGTFSCAHTPNGRLTPLVGAGKKLTWSERQALAKKQAEEEETRSKAASFQAPAPAAAPRSFGWVPPRPPVASEPEEEETYVPVRLSCHQYV